MSFGVLLLWEKAWRGLAFRTINRAGEIHLLISRPKALDYCFFYIFEGLARRVNWAGTQVPRSSREMFRLYPTSYDLIDITTLHDKLYLMNLFTKLPLVFSVLLLAGGTVQAQVKKIPYRNRVADTVVLVNTQEKAMRVKPPKPLSKERALGFRINTDGWNAYYNYGFIKKNDREKHEIDRYFDVLFVQLEIGEKRHPKEIRDFAYDGSGRFRNGFLSAFSTDYFRYGKINTFYQAKLGIGYKKLIAGKPDPNSVSIHWSTVGGFSMGILKPYYFESSMGTMKIDPATAYDVLPSVRLLGGYGYRRGWDELKFVPGLHLRSGLKFDYADKRRRLAGIEVGLNVETYFSKIDQMAFQDPKSFFLNAYAAFEIGWKK